jgi:hypothetical protein
MRGGFLLYLCVPVRRVHWIRAISYRKIKKLFSDQLKYVMLNRHKRGLPDVQPLYSCEQWAKQPALTRIFGGCCKGKCPMGAKYPALWG